MHKIRKNRAEKVVTISISVPRRETEDLKELARILSMSVSGLLLDAWRARKYRYQYFAKHFDGNSEGVEKYGRFSRFERVFDKNSVHGSNGIEDIKRRSAHC